ncbi:Imm8 family immunity protein [Rhizobium sp. 18055]|uniref:Imm8 family immunity protein n=1 Tax=Rhizobium sp. 18055 TaxID=2681403 RepID=UPI00135C6048|nr:Imm8 family immunity protein [Rhizobium sp. 18055]
MTRGYIGFYITEDEDWHPANLTDFGYWMDFYVGDDRGSDAFTVLVCTPSWFARERGAEVTSGRNVIFMPRFDRNALDNFLRAECTGEIGKGTETTMLKIDGIGEWEFRYRSL